MFKLFSYLNMYLICAFLFFISSFSIGHNVLSSLHILCLGLMFGITAVYLHRTKKLRKLLQKLRIHESEYKYMEVMSVVLLSIVFLQCTVLFFFSIFT